MSRRLLVLASSLASRSMVMLWLVGASSCSSGSSHQGNGTGGAATGSGGAVVGTGGVVAGTGGTYPLPIDAGQTGFLTWIHNGQPVGFYLPPPSDQPLPVVMFLHGCGNNPVTPSWWIIDALNQVEPCAVLLPFRPKDESPTCSAWGGTYDDDLRPAMVDALAGLDSVIARFGLDSKRQYLYGESMGAEGVLMLLVQFPIRFAGAVVVGGYTLHKGAEQMAQTPLWLIHGSADSTNPAATIETIYQSILNAGGTLVKLTTYEGMEHSPAIVKARSEPGLLDWLLAQRHDGILRNPVIPIVDGGALDGEATTMATVTLEVTGIDTTYDGMSVAVALLPGEAECSSWAQGEVLGSGEATVVTGACDVSLPSVPEGMYTACAFVDADGNFQPSPGDLAGQLLLSVSGNKKEPWIASDWVKI